VASLVASCLPTRFFCSALPPVGQGSPGSHDLAVPRKLPIAALLDAVTWLREGS
jgi:hypothetical protein